MRDISARKRFIESEFAPEDTSVIWLKLANDSENINNMRIEDMLQFVNGRWSSILNSGGGSSDIPNPFEGIDPNAKVLIMRANASYDGESWRIYAYASESGSYVEFSEEPIVDGKPNIGAILGKLYPDVHVPNIAVFGYVYKDGAFQATSKFEAHTQAGPVWELAEEVVFIAVATLGLPSSDPMYFFDWPEGLEELKLTWDDLN